MAGVAAFAGPAMLDRVGQPPGEAHLQYAAQLVESLPAPLVSAAHEPHGARALVYALLLDRAAGLRQRQLAHLAGAADPGVIVVIQTFVYPNAWTEHLGWSSILVLLLTRGPGALSLDHLIERRFNAAGSAAAKSGR